MGNVIAQVLQLLQLKVTDIVPDKSAVPPTEVDQTGEVLHALYWTDSEEFQHRDDGPAVVCFDDFGENIVEVQFYEHGIPRQYSGYTDFEFFTDGRIKSMMNYKVSKRRQQAREIERVYVTSDNDMPGNIIVYDKYIIMRWYCDGESNHLHRVCEPALVHVDPDGTIKHEEYWHKGYRISHDVLVESGFYDADDDEVRQFIWEMVTNNGL